MLIPIKWLKEYIETDQIDDNIANTLTLAGLTIEEINNHIMDGEVTANRPDWLSIYGIAREYAALTNTPLKNLPVPKFDTENKQIINVVIDPSLIIRYSGYVIQNIKVGPSPDWLKEKLHSVGIRSINNVVDVTNYIMMETGQPLHAFDIDKMEGDLILRRAKGDEFITTLDQIKRKTSEDTIVIENSGQLVDLSGIMGGASSETSKNTNNIFLQGAVFPPKLIRKSSKTIKLSTDASYRYERGVDNENSIQYLNLAVEMIIQLCGGNVVQHIDILPSIEKPQPINWSLDQAESLLGITITQENALKWLNALGIKTTVENNHFSSISPSWRQDIIIKEDIFEELARFATINNFPRTQLKPTVKEKQNSEYTAIEYTKDQLVNIGLTEIDGYSFLSARNLLNANLDPNDCMEASNPLSEEFQYLRPSLFPDMLLAVSQNPSFNPILLFEIGNIFLSRKEETKLGIILASTDKDITKYTEKISHWAETTLNKPLEFKKIEATILDKYKIRKSEVYFIEIQIETIISFLKNKTLTITIPKMDQKFTPISKYPSVKRDLAIIIDEKIDPSEILKTIINTKPNDTIEILSELFDEFISDKFGLHKKSLAFHILYQSNTKTLNDTEVDQMHSKIIDVLKLNYQAIPRI